MGEHKDDKSIEEKLEEEAQEKARLLAEQEAEELRYLDHALLSDLGLVPKSLCKSIIVGRVMLSSSSA